MTADQVGAKRPFPWVAAFLTLGLGLRAYHYLREPSMWHDEAALVLNVLGKSYGECFGPLFFSEAAPPLFLWIEKLACSLLGDGTYALRLVPFLASCLALVLFVPLARRILVPAAVPWAVMLFACSDHVLWHTCEAKPYAVDVLAGTLLAALYCCLSRWPLVARLTLFAVLAPLLLFFSYPTCFLYGGLLVALLIPVKRCGRWPVWLAYGLLSVIVLAAFSLLYAGPIRAQRNETILACWLGSFPPWDRPWKVPIWLVLSTFEVFRYCCEPIGQVFLPLAVAGAIGLWRRRQREIVALLATPLALALAASLIRAYPYGGSRVIAYEAPAAYLLIATAIPVVFAWLRTRSRVATLLFLGIVLTPVGWAARNVISPWPRADCAGAADYVLTQRLPNDPIAGNHWEYLYYFRHLGSQYQPLVGRAPEPADRLWLVLTDARPGQRQVLARLHAPDGCQVLEQREFRRTTVLLLRRQPSVASSP